MKGKERKGKKRKGKKGEERKEKNGKKGRKGSCAHMAAGWRKGRMSADEAACKMLRKADEILGR